MALQTITKDILTRTSGAALLELPYDVAFTAGFDYAMVKENIAVETYGELVMSRSGTFVGEAGYIDVAGSGVPVIVDIFKNGTTIYGSTKPQFPGGNTSLTPGVITVATFASGDRITFKVTQTGQAEPGEGVRFNLKGKV